MGIVSTHTEGRVVTHERDDAGGIEVAQLPARDGVVSDATADTATRAPRVPPVKAATPPAAVRAATTQKAARVKKAATSTRRTKKR